MIFTNVLLIFTSIIFSCFVASYNETVEKSAHSEEKRNLIGRRRGALFEVIPQEGCGSASVQSASSGRSKRVGGIMRTFQVPTTEYVSEPATELVREPIIIPVSMSAQAAPQAESLKPIIIEAVERRREEGGREDSRIRDLLLQQIVDRLGERASQGTPQAASASAPFQIPLFAIAPNYVPPGIGPFSFKQQGKSTEGAAPPM